MSVKDIEVCKNGVIVTVHNGYFICDEQDLDIVNEMPWRFGTKGYITHYISKGSTELKTKYERCTFSFHQQVAFKFFGHYVSTIDHFNTVPFDNRGSNLNILSLSANNTKRDTAGYIMSNDGRKNNFRAIVQLDSVNFRKDVSSEYLALLERVKLGSVHFKTNEGYINYNPAHDLSTRLDLLLQEVQGTITKEDMYHLRLKEVAQNPWYIYRYGLEDECKLHSILIPNFIEDKSGFMCNKEGIRLCPKLPNGFSREGWF